MQKVSNYMPKIFDTIELTDKVPVSPLGKLFCMYPSTHPELLHFHNFLEIGYCESGSGLFIIDGRIIPYNGKTCSVIYPGQAHIAQDSEQNNSLWHFLYIDVSKLFSGVGVPPISGLNATNYKSFEFDNLFSISEMPDLYNLIMSILYETSENKTMYRQSVTGLVYSMLIKHSRLMKPNADAEIYHSLSAELSQVLNYINVNYMNDLTIKELEKISNMSKPTLLRKMKAFINMSPMEYMHSLRLSKATLLLHTDKTIAEISNCVGYNTLSCFNRKFFDRYKMSPSKYKKMPPL